MEVGLRKTQAARHPNSRILRLSGLARSTPAVRTPVAPGARESGPPANRLSISESSRFTCIWGVSLSVGGGARCGSIALVVWTPPYRNVIQPIARLRAFFSGTVQIEDQSGRRFALGLLLPAVAQFFFGPSCGGFEFSPIHRLAVMVVGRQTS